MADESENILEAVELAKKTGKLKKGANEVTKVVERGLAKLVVIAKDTNPPEITMHLPALCKEKHIACVFVPKKEDLGLAAGLGVGTSCIAIVQEGEAREVIKGIAEQADN